MQPSDFHYDLPPELIAQAPLPERAASRLMVLDATSDTIEDCVFPDLLRLLAPGDLLVLNDTRVLPARVIGRKPTGGRVELLLERVIAPREALMQVGARRRLPVGAAIELPGSARAEVKGRAGPFYRIAFDRDVVPWLDTHGQVPLPPYIAREPDRADRERYQTVFAESPGAVAAPTAGLHFDRPLLETLRANGVEQAFVTLHVGAGTFAPVRAEHVEDHQLHAERLEVSAGLCDRVAATRQRGGRVVAAGTTVVRALEAAAAGGSLAPFSGDTRLFIYPGYRFRVVDAILTNFHLPESSLLMLVAAFAGHERTLSAYRHAVAQRYRFFSYGDAMFVRPKRPRTGERADAL
jgi:S-adenosylmethionine:tRNA ribosyltransferase-isomerase